MHLKLKNVWLVVVSFASGFLLCALIMSQRHPQPMSAAPSAHLSLLAAGLQDDQKVLFVLKGEDRVVPLHIDSSAQQPSEMDTLLGRPAPFPEKTPARSLHLVDKPTSVSIDLSE